MLTANRRTKGFTLVELLVVVTIIGILAGLMMVAINAARRAAMRGRCANHLRELAQGAVHYEQVKQGYPGFANNLKGKRVSWVVMLLPYINREDLFAVWRDSSGAPTAVRVNQTLCPADTLNASMTDGLSFVVNFNIFIDRFANPQKKYSGEDLESAAMTPMISERIDTTARVWGGTNPTQAAMTFTWPYPPTNDLIITRVNSNHGGGSHVAFCDGHVEYLVDNTRCDQFLAGPKIR